MSPVRKKRLPSRSKKASSSASGALPVPLHHLRSANHDLALLVRAKLFERLRVYYPRVNVEVGHAEALELRAVGGIQVSLRDCLREAVALLVSQSYNVVELFTDRSRQRRPTAPYHNERGEIVLAYIRFREEVHDHGGDVRPVGNAVALHEFGGDIPVPAGHQHDGAAGVDRGVHAVLHPRDVEERQHAQGDARHRRSVPNAPSHERRLQGAVRVDAAFRLSGST